MFAKGGEGLQGCGRERSGRISCGCSGKVLWMARAELWTARAGLWKARAELAPSCLAAAAAGRGRHNSTGIGQQVRAPAAAVREGVEG
jgi:hypothetical protein